MKVCIGDTYFDKISSRTFVIISCLNSQADVDKLKESFMKLNPKDLPEPKEKIDASLEKTFKVFFTDGLEAFLNKTLTFKPDAVYEADKLLFNYALIEPMEGQKCEVYQNLPIFPLKFLENNIIVSKCLLKFKYDGLEIFLGNLEKNCEEITQYISEKMKTNCLNYINGPQNKFSKIAKSSPFNGEWSGYVFYHNLILNVESKHANPNLNSVVPDQINNNPLLLEVNQSLIKITNAEIGNLSSYIEYKDIKFACNDLGDCNLWEYINYLKKLDPKENIHKILLFENMVKNVREKWFLNDLNYCFVIDNSDIDIICPRDPS